MTYPPPGGTPDPYQPPQQFGPPPSDPTAPASGAPSSGQPYGAPPPYGAPSSGQPYGASPPSSGQPFGGQPSYSPPGDPYAQSYGAKQAYGPGYSAPTTTNVMAILSLVFAFVFAPAGIVLGHIARKQIRQTGEQGQGLATAGLILSYVAVGFYILVCGLWVALAASGIATTTTTN